MLCLAGRHLSMRLPNRLGVGPCNLDVGHEARARLDRDLLVAGLPALPHLAVIFYFLGGDGCFC